MNNMGKIQDSLQEDLRRKMHHARMLAGLTQAEVAEKMGTEQPRISLAENGKDAFSLKFAERFIEACGCKLKFHHVSLVHEKPGQTTTYSSFLGNI